LVVEGGNMRIAIDRGLSIAVESAPEQRLSMASSARHVAVKGADYRGLKPSVQVKVNDRVGLGDVLFTDRLDPRLRVTAPGAGVVVAINRGVRRKLTSVVIRLEGTAAADFTRYSSRQINTLDTDQVQQLLLQSGLWTALRARPFDNIPTPATRPRWLFVTAMDTNPGALDPQLVITPYQDEFADGLRMLARLGAEAIYLCHGPNAEIPVPEEITTLRKIQFDGPHPAGLPGTHIQYLARPNVGAQAWHINYQDVVAIGKLVRHGELWTERSIALSGAVVRQPRLLRTRLGAKLSELLSDDISSGQTVLSGSVLSGQVAYDTTDYLGRYHQQVYVLPAAEPQRNWRSNLRRLTALLGTSPTEILHNRATTLGGSGLLPVEAFESVWPFANAPVPLLRALLVADAEAAATQGCLALAEEDLALLSVVCPAKRDYGAALRRTLDTLEQD
jgi:Na+-transporting NADH:ubiquinone oxidoreductase subunit A